MPGFRLMGLRREIPFSLLERRIQSEEKREIELRDIRFPLTPTRLWVDPAFARQFAITKFLIGITPQFLEPIPCTSFGVTNGAMLKMAVCEPGMSITIRVKNMSDLEILDFEGVLWCEELERVFP